MGGLQQKKKGTRRSSCCKRRRQWQRSDCCSKLLLLIHVVEPSGGAGEAAYHLPEEGKSINNNYYCSILPSSVITFIFLMCILYLYILKRKKVITDGTEQLINLLANDTPPLQLPTFLRHEVMPSSQSHQVGQTPTRSHHGNYIIYIYIERVKFKQNNLRLASMQMSLW